MDSVLSAPGWLDRQREVRQSKRIRKAALPVLLEARPHSVKATGQFLEGSGPEAVWPSVGAWQQ